MLRGMLPPTSQPRYSEAAWFQAKNIVQMKIKETYTEAIVVLP